MSPISEHAVVASEDSEEENSGEAVAAVRGRDEVGASSLRSKDVPDPIKTKSKIPASTASSCTCASLLNKDVNSMKQRRASLNLPFNSKPDSSVMDMVASMASKQQRRPLNAQQLSPSPTFRLKQSPSRMRGGKTKAAPTSRLVLRSRWKQHQESSYSLDCSSATEAAGLAGEHHPSCNAR